jgi:hypothetical protein
MLLGALPTMDSLKRGTFVTTTDGQQHLVTVDGSLPDDVVVSGGQLLTRPTRAPRVSKNAVIAAVAKAAAETPPAPKSSTSSALASLDNISPAAQMVLPGAVCALVNRKKHPIIFWGFGVLPLAGAVATAIKNKRFL